MYKNNIDGYKCFNKDLTSNIDGFSFKPNRIYTMNKDIKYHKRGFHFALRLEDTLRFFDEEKEICRIKALGDIDWSNDDYYEYYDLGCTNIIYIGKIMTKEEIINYIDKVSDNRFIRFIQGYKLTNEELNYFKEKYKNNNYVLEYLKYYQEKEEDIFDKYYGKILKR